MFRVRSIRRPYILGEQFQNRLVCPLHALIKKKTRTHLDTDYSDEQNSKHNRYFFLVSYSRGGVGRGLLSSLLFVDRKSRKSHGNGTPNATYSGTTERNDDGNNNNKNNVRKIPIRRAGRSRAHKTAQTAIAKFGRLSFVFVFFSLRPVERNHSAAELAANA